MQQQAKAGKQQSRAHEQGEGKANLRGDEELAHPAGFSPAGARAVFLPQRVVYADSANASEGKESDKEARNQRQRKRETRTTVVST